MPSPRADRVPLEPGDLELRLAASSADHRLVAAVTPRGPVRTVDHTWRLHPRFTVVPLPAQR